MKFRIIYFFFWMLISTVLFLSFSGGPARTQGQDRTGSPFTEGGTPCQGCHSAGAFSPELTVEIMDGDVAVTEYEPEKSYTFRASIATTGAPAEFGFQAVALSGADDVNAGTFGTPDEDMSVINLNDRDYVEHNMPRTEGLFEIEWKAPEAGTGEVRIYAACVAANNSNSTAGDGSVRLVDPVVITEMSTSIGILGKQQVSLNTFPNPVIDALNIAISLENASQFDLRLFNATGQLMRLERVDLQAGENNRRINVGDLPAGVYYIQLSNGSEGITERILKQ